VCVRVCVRAITPDAAASQHQSSERRRELCGPLACAVVRCTLYIMHVVLRLTSHGTSYMYIQNTGPQVDIILTAVNTGVVVRGWFGEAAKTSPAHVVTGTTLQEYSMSTGTTKKFTFHDSESQHSLFMTLRANIHFS
jgi:hypothetical protein